MLHVHRAERADRLADALADTLLDPLDDPFMADVVAVPTRGIERWLAQRLSTRLGASPGRQDGVCANIDFPFPGRLVVGALAEATGVDPDEDPWRAERSVWPLLQVVDECLTEPWLQTLAAHLNATRPEPADPMRRFGVVRHIADLFDRYGIHRPDLVRAWAAANGNGAQPTWQPELWRRLRVKIGQPSPAERLETAAGVIRSQPDVLDLPPRLSIFGLTRMPRSYLDVLGAVAEHRDVHLFVLHPSPALWAKVANEVEPAQLVTREEDPTKALPRNRLLASWGRDARELQLVLRAATADSVDHHHPLEQQPATLLERIQTDITSDRRPPTANQADERFPLHPDDNSIQLHGCHGRARQVEVLRDVILHLLEDDPTLEPRDVIVMCPDIETFAPLIHATFGTGVDEDAEKPDLRVRLADRSLRQTNPVLSVVSQLLNVADQRATASQLLDLVDREPVRRRFGLDDDGVARMREWVAASGIRWGFDAPHRAPYMLQVVDANTWRAGLDRILLGITMTEEDRRLVAGVLPLDDVESGVVELAGRFAEYIDRIKAAAAELTTAQPLEAWAEAIANAADALTRTTERDSWQRSELQRILDDLVDEAHHGTPGTNLELADVRALLADRLRGRPTRANFRTGHLTICTLVPMRSVPHRIVCVLGLDDGEFPRRTARDGDDLMLRAPHVGDRDPRTEDRQMLLDALMAATDKFIITYTANDERTNLPRPPAVPVAELLDVIDATVSMDNGQASERVVIRHPLQPFDPVNFAPDALVRNQPWSFDAVALAGARALIGPRAEPPPFLRAPLPPLGASVIELERLVRFVEHPVKAFLRDRLEIRLGEFSDEVKDSLPVELDPLEKWHVGQRLLEGVLAGEDLRRCMRAELVRGELPPNALATQALEGLTSIVEELALAAKGVASEPPSSRNVHVELADGRELVGTVPGVCGRTIRIVSFSRVKPKDRLRAWVRLLALSAAYPEVELDAVVIGRAPSGAMFDVRLVRIPTLGDDPTGRRDVALAQLAVLVDLYERGMREPAPLSCETSAAYAAAAYAGGDPQQAAQKKWETGYNYDGEDAEPEHVAVYGGMLAFADLLEDAPRADERWSPEKTRFGVYARRLWDELLAREKVSEQ